MYRLIIVLNGTESPAALTKRSIGCRICRDLNFLTINLRLQKRWLHWFVKNNKTIGTSYHLVSCFHQNQSQESVKVVTKFAEGPFNLLCANLLSLVAL